MYMYKIKCQKRPYRSEQLPLGLTVTKRSCVWTVKSCEYLWVFTILQWVRPLRSNLTDISERRSVSRWHFVLSSTFSSVFRLCYLFRSFKKHIYIHSILFTYSIYFNFNLVDIFVINTVENLRFFVEKCLLFVEKMSVLL